MRKESFCIQNEPSFENFKGEMGNDNDDYSLEKNLTKAKKKTFQLVRKSFGDGFRKGWIFMFSSRKF